MSEIDKQRRQEVLDFFEKFRIDEAEWWLHCCDCAKVKPTDSHRPIGPDNWYCDDGDIFEQIDTMHLDMLLVNCPKHVRR